MEPQWDMEHTAVAVERGGGDLVFIQSYSTGGHILQHSFLPFSSIPRHLAARPVLHTFPARFNVPRQPLSKEHTRFYEPLLVCCSLVFSEVFELFFLIFLVKN